MSFDTPDKNCSALYIQTLKRIVKHKYLEIFVYNDILIVKYNMI